MKKDYENATFSHCTKYRYSLCRVWDFRETPLRVVMLNPSTADYVENDRTVLKLIKIAKNNGFGSIYVVNLFAFVSSDPDVLDKVADPVGEMNEGFIDGMMQAGRPVLVAWGSNKAVKDRAAWFLDRYSAFDLHCLHINKDGNPKHPLYCKDNSKLIPYER